MWAQGTIVMILVFVATVVVLVVDQVVPGGHTSHVERQEASLSKTERASEVFACSGSRHYNLEISFSWSGFSHPGAYPSNGAFSAVVAASHGQFYTMWAPRGYSSRGVQTIAETGRSNALLNELTREQGRDVLSVESSTGPVDGAETVKLMLRVNSGRTRVSAISGLMPSPDWFTGVENIDLCDAETGRWVRSKSGDLSVWDAGTNRGTVFESNAEANRRFQPVRSILAGRFNSVPVGTWRLVRA